MAGRTLSVELHPLRGESPEAVARRLADLGAPQVPGYRPVPMPPKPGAKPTLVITVIVPNASVETNLRQADGVVQVYGDARIGPF